MGVHGEVRHFLDPTIWDDRMRLDTWSIRTAAGAALSVGVLVDLGRRRWNSHSRVSTG